MIGLALRSSRANERPSYFMAVDTLPNVALTCDPRPFTAAIIATAIPAAMTGNGTSLAIATPRSTRTDVLAGGLMCYSTDRVELNLTSPPTRRKTF